MDFLHAIGFYVSAALSVAGGLFVAFLPGRSRRGLSLAVVAIGVSGIYLSLSAGFAAIVALVCYGGCALLLAGSTYRIVEPAVGGRWRQVGAVAAAALTAVLAYAAYRSDFARATFFGGPIGSAALGRRLFAHDVLATEAVAALVLVALVGATLAWRRASARSGVGPTDRARERSK
jgi:NADH:ubiquinone oxidoreductase subunit 6 (subunit J)